MSFRLVPKSVTLNDLERRNGLTLRYCTKFGKPAFHLLTASSSTELIVQKSASITQNGEVGVCTTLCVTKFMCGHDHTNLLD